MNSKKRRKNRGLQSQLDDFDQDAIIGDAQSSRRLNVIVNDGTDDPDFSVKNICSISTTNENTVNVQTLERCFNEWIDREMGNIVDTVEDRIRNEILNLIDNMITPRIELAARSPNASSGQDAVSVTANSEGGESIGITASFEKVSEKNDTFHEKPIVVILRDKKYFSVNVRTRYPLLRPESTDYHLL